MASIKDIQNALCDVRKAHRILYAYQKRMMDIVMFICQKLDFNCVKGYKFFSNNAPKKILPGTWAWDYIYSYLYEYFLDEKEDIEQNNVFRMSIIQYSDTGFFDNEKSTRTKLATFATEEESQSKVLFMLEVKPKNCTWWWKTNDIINDKNYASKSHTSTILEKGNNKIVLYSIPIEKFLNEDATIDVLNEFCDFCRVNGIMDLTLH